MTPGSIVRCRNREWVLVPSDEPEVLLLRPLTGATGEAVAVHRRLVDLAAYSLPEERVRSATFPPPTLDDLSNAAASHLLWQAARLTLREGATPFRSLGRISIRPRTYQFVPLLMALRLDPVRLLIADDVGVGKTIEALLIARELLDRGEIKRLCVLCPPYLCEQWQKELAEKFNLDAEIIRSGTVGQLERRKTSPDSIYKYYPVQVVSIDFAKSDRNKPLFLLDCPGFIIVDEAHGAAAANAANTNQHQRHELVRELAANPDRHIVLLTATPHSGIDAAFRSLLSLVRPEFGNWNTTALEEPQRIELARHFAQRTRKDIEKDWEHSDCFPRRDSDDKTYRLSEPYRDLFNRTYAFCSELVRSGQRLGKRQQRVRYWGALALLRCVMSSPAAALAALAGRHDRLPNVDEAPDFRTFIFESGSERTDDSQPTPPIEAAEAEIPDADRRQLRDLGRRAAALVNSRDDSKLAEATKLVANLLEDGFHPIVWCRYIATAKYAADHLGQQLARDFPGLRVIAVTGNLTDEERRAKIDEIATERFRVLVATDCLSEGVNLQHAFNAAIHYDLPWNPNRLEQREGRVDRYGQQGRIDRSGKRHLEVRTIRYFSPDSPVDGVVLSVLLNKAREIHRTLGTHVPVPEESESVTEAVLNALFLRGDTSATADAAQLEFGLTVPGVESFHEQWDLRVAREKQSREKLNRTRFAQRALKPDEVQRELEATDAVLGDPAAVQAFVLNAAQRINLPVARDRKQPELFRIGVADQVRAALPDAIAFALPSPKSGRWTVSFASPTPEMAEYLGRNHPFVTALAQFLMEEALTQPGAARAARCGALRTRSVTRLTTLALVRVRYLLQQPGRAPLLAEEVRVFGYRDRVADWLPEADTLRLLAEAQPDANLEMPEKRELITHALKDWEAVQPAIKARLSERAEELAASHRRIRQAVQLKVRNLTVEPKLPADLLGVLVLQPVAQHA
jgi:superfamily II DNA or RNA helicase